MSKYYYDEDGDFFYRGKGNEVIYLDPDDMQNVLDNYERQLAEKKRELEYMTELLIKLKAHKKEALTVSENIKFRELTERGDEQTPT